MSDIVERLRMRPDSDCRDGADEIDRLRGLLTEMRTTEAMAELQEEKMGLCREIERLRAREAELVALLQRALKLAQLWSDINATLAKVEDKI